MKLKALLFTIALAIAGYWYFSPFLALQQLDAAAKRGDAAAFNNMVDFPKVRESVKTQLAALLGEHLPKLEQPDSVLGRAGAALGARLGSAMLNGVVDQLIRPETVMRAMQEHELRAGTVAGTPPSPEQNGEKRKWDYEREGVDKLVVYAVDPKHPDQTRQEQFGLVLERSGFATWRLTGIRLSSRVKAGEGPDGRPAFSLSPQ
jgi:hypothetical protein